MKNRFLVLLSTFNGEEFLEQLLKSLVQQEGVSIKLLVRDDGSTDRTIEILSSYCNFLEMEVLQGLNIGSNRSFQELFQLARKEDFDYLAFCDQDDIWHPSKLKRASDALMRNRKSFYASKRNLINSDGKSLGLHPSGRVKPGFTNSIVENVCAGCTTVLTESFFRKIVEVFPFEVEGDIDHILYMLAASNNGCYFDQESRISYRVHSRNQFGIRSSYFLNLKESIDGVKRKMTTAVGISKVIANFSDPVNSHLILKLTTRQAFLPHAFAILQMPKLRQKIFEDVLIRIFLITNKKFYKDLSRQSSIF